MWSFVGGKICQVWVWALDADTRAGGTRMAGENPPLRNGVKNRGRVSILEEKAGGVDPSRLLFLPESIDPRTRILANRSPKSAE